MDFLELAKRRYSVRKYKDRQVEQEKLDSILQAGRIAPTAANKQPNHFLVLNDSASMAKLAKGAKPHGAPMAIITCADSDTVWVRPYDNKAVGDIDATIATDHMMMQAQDIGLSSCWITHFDPAVIREEFNIPKNLIPVNVLVIGYADEQPQSPQRHDGTRKDIKDMVHYGTF